MASYEKFAKLTVSCTNEKLGCCWRGLLKDLEEHASTCDRELLRNAIINIQRLEARLDMKDRETVYLKNDFSLKVEMIAKQRKLKARDEFEKFEKVAVILKDEVEKLRVEKNEEMEQMKEEMATLKTKNEELETEISNLKKTPENNPSQQQNVVSPPTTTTIVSTSSESSSSQIPKSLTVKANASITFFDFTDGGKPLGRVIVKLFTTQAPENCAKFLKLCTHETGLGYCGSKVSHVDSAYYGFGRDDHLIYPTSGREFPSALTTPLENLSAKHDRRRLVSLSSNSNTPSKGVATKSYVRVLRTPYSSHDGKHVIIGEVTEETWSVVEKLKYGSIISDCGIID